MPPKKIKMTGQSGEHMKNVVVKNEGKDGAHKCVMCEATLPSKNELQAHFRLHANGQIDMKGRCMRTLQATKPNKALVQSKAELKDPLAPTEVVWIQCDACPESFETVTLAIQHKFRKHPGSQKKYYCGFCGKQFPLEVCKSNHISGSHVAEEKGSKIYQCKDCTAQFFNVEAIKYHIRSSHQRVTALINPTATFGPSKKIKLNISGEPNSVFYCHLCGHEYMVKFNLQKHLETSHSAAERAAGPEQLIKCKLCEAVFYNKKAWDSHNMLHSPSDLYIHNEEDRKLAVARVDQDFDQSRVPSMLDKLLPVPGSRQRVLPVETSTNQNSVSGVPGRDSPGLGKNRAVVDSDSDLDGQSDTSIESEEEEEDGQVLVEKTKKRKKRAKNKND